jgi:hypothetical protein
LRKARGNIHFDINRIRIYADDGAAYDLYNQPALPSRRLL